MPFNEDPDVQITTPNSSTDWTAGTSHTIYWTAVPGTFLGTDGTINNFVLYLYNGSTQVSTIASGLGGSQRSYIWAIPQSLAGDTDYRVRIRMDYTPAGI